MCIICFLPVQSNCNGSDSVSVMLIPLALVLTIVNAVIIKRDLAVILALIVRKFLR